MKSNKRYLCLKIAGQIFIVKSKDKRILDLINKCFSGFVSKESDYPVTINIDLRRDFSGNPYEGRRPHQLNITDLGTYLTVNGEIFTGCLNIKERAAEVSISLSAQAFYLFLRFITIVILAENRGFIIHSSSVADSGLGYIFAGRPNSGKSTMARLSTGKRILCDDFSIVKQVNGQFMVFPSPFWGSVQPGGEDRGDFYPVKGVYFLNQADEDFVMPVKSWQNKFSLLHQNVLMFPKLKNQALEIFKLESELVNSVLVSKLYFTNNNSVWRCLK